MPQVQDDRGSISGDGAGVGCHYENLRLAEPAMFIAHSQKSTFDLPFYAETADDFVLTDPNDPDGLNPCLLDQVQFAVTHDVPGVSPDNWTGVKITIYQDRGNVCLGQPLDFPCQRNPDKGPAGYPLASDDPALRQHNACCGMPDKEAIVCELKVPMSKVTWTPIIGGPPDSYDIVVSGLEQYECLLQKNKKYWVAPAPVMDNISPGGIDQGFIFLWTSPNIADHEAQVISEFLNGQWSGIQSQLQWPFQDLYLAVWATKAPTGEPCHYENLRLGLKPPFGVTHSQKSTFDVPFYSETADDFILTDPDDPDGQNGCLLEQVTFAVAHDVPGVSPKNWNGVKITIYQDRGTVCGGQPQALQCERNPQKGPAGYPLPPGPDGQREPHGTCCLDPTKEAVVCELKVPMSKVSFIPLPFPGSYEITVFGLDQYNCVLEKNKKYWIAPAPEMDIMEPVNGTFQGATFLWTSPNPMGHEAQVISEFFGFPLWSSLQSQIGWFEPDLYLSVWASKAPVTQPACEYENLRLTAGLLPAPPTHSQKSTSIPPFYAETADDFVLSDPDDPDGDNLCRLDEVQFAVFHTVPNISPQNWQGVKITIYQDRGNVCGGQPQMLPCTRNPQKGPAGYPKETDNADVRDHDSCCLDPSKEAIVCELKVPMSQVAWAALPGFPPGAYEIFVTGLRDQFLCDLEKNKKYWIAPAPVLDSMDAAGNFQGETFLFTSPNPADHEAQSIFAPGGLWSLISGQLQFPERNLYLAIRSNKLEPVPCPWDCANNDGEVGIDEFLEVLARWGVSPGNPCDFNGDGVVGIDEFLKILAVWGPCP